MYQLRQIQQDTSTVLKAFLEEPPTLKGHAMLVWDENTWLCLGRISGKSLDAQGILTIKMGKGGLVLAIDTNMHHMKIEEEEGCYQIQTDEGVYSFSREL